MRRRTSGDDSAADGVQGDYADQQECEHHPQIVTFRELRDMSRVPHFS